MSNYEMLWPHAYAKLRKSFGFVISGYEHPQMTDNGQGRRNFYVGGHNHNSTLSLCSEVVDCILGKMNTGLYGVSPFPKL